MASLQRTFLAGLLAVAALLLPSLWASSSPDPSSAAGRVARLAKDTLFWGPYKPNLYFGIQPRTPAGLWTGLMWTTVNQYEDMKREFRYTCEQHQGIHGYGWDEFDARLGGVQTIRDEENMIDLTTTFVKLPGSGGGGGSWAARIRGTPRPGAPADTKTILALWVAQEGDLDSGSELGVDDTNRGDQFGYTGDLSMVGRSAALGEYGLRVTQGRGRHPDASEHPIMKTVRRGDRIVVQSLNMAANTLWHAKQALYHLIRDTVKFVQENMDEPRYPPGWLMYALEHRPGTGNSHLVQRVFEGADFEFDVIFSSWAGAAAGAADVTSDDVTSAIAAMRRDFADRFDRVFALQPPYDGKDSGYAAFGRSMFANLLGGIGYFHGDQLVDRSHAPEYDEDEEGFWFETAAARARRAHRPEGPYELFTAVPSRPFFPRGFLWDEGFHLLPVADWDLDLALEVVRSWLGTMDEDGWIAREQILGDEARSKVPDEFQVQYPHYANPPTLFLVIDALLDRLERSDREHENENDADNSGDVPLRSAHADVPGLGREFLAYAYPLLRRHYDWFRRTQAGDLRSYDREARSRREAYRWRGRTETHVLPSGLDDYPRPQPPHPAELHVDLLSWVGLMARSLNRVATALGLDDDAAEHAASGRAIRDNLDDLHWSEPDGCFCDATVDAYEEHALVCHRGYVSLFPFLAGIMGPHDDRLGRMLDLISDENQLWSGHGLRSLSRSDPLYGTGENYWRGPIWVNINYLALTQLQAIARQQGAHQARAADLHSRLRRNVVDTVYESWRETGFAWEQYNPDTGRGQRTQHFTGWTSLVVKMMTQEEIVVGGDADKDAADKAAGKGAAAKGEDQVRGERGERGERDERDERDEL